MSNPNDQDQVDEFGIPIVDAKEIWSSGAGDLEDVVDGEPLDYEMGHNMLKRCETTGEGYFLVAFQESKGTFESFMQSINPSLAANIAVVLMLKFPEIWTEVKAQMEARFEKS